ncbi:Ig-like domain-containing protein, partial [Celeribacter halophilus]|uniref:Ig-like domain-containing protein n=1 Tax=Celeribacter halophilus TaxID=576117 RepID=UPI0026E359BC
SGGAVTVNVMENDADADGDDLTIDQYTQPNNGTVTENDDGTLSYTANDGFVGTDSFTYTVTDGQGGYDTKTVTIDVSAKTDDNTPPAAKDDSGTVESGGSVTVNVMENDADADGDDLTIDQYTQP